MNKKSFLKNTRVAMSVFTMISLLILITVNTKLSYAAPTDVPDYVTQFGNYLSTTIEPQRIAVAPNNTVYVTDSTNNIVVQYSSNGDYISSFGSAGIGNGQLANPTGIAVDSTGAIFVVDSFNHRIQKFNSSGVYQSQFGTPSPNCTNYAPTPTDGTLCFPSGIVISSSNEIYIADNANQRIQKFNSSSVYQSQFGTIGTGQGQFGGPTAIAINSVGDIYVVDNFNHRIQKFNSSGVYQSQFGTYGSGDANFIFPIDIAIDSSDYVYVVDKGNNRIQKFNSSNVFLTEFGTTGSANSQFNTPNGIAIDNADDIYVADTNNDRIQKFHYPVNIATLSNAMNNQEVLLETPTGTDITCSDAVTEASLTQQDPGHSYPVGLVDFCLDVANGSTHTITLTFVTDLIPTDVIARKYIASSSSYISVPGAVITETTLNTQHALQLVYDITDGGLLDDDSTVNGEIIDPVGLAVAIPPVTGGSSGSSAISSDSAGSLANTGANHTLYLIGAITSISLALLTIKYKFDPERY